MTCGAFRGAACYSIRNGSRAEISKRIPIHEREVLSAIPPSRHVPLGNINEHPWLVMNVPKSHKAQSVAFAPKHCWQAPEHCKQLPPEAKVPGGHVLFVRAHSWGWPETGLKLGLHIVHAPVPSEHCSHVEWHAKLP